MSTEQEKAKAYDAIVQIVGAFIEDVEYGANNEVYASYGMQRMQEIRAEIVGVGDECEEIPVPVTP